MQTITDYDRHHLPLSSNCPTNFPQAATQTSTWPTTTSNASFRNSASSLATTTKGATMKLRIENIQHHRNGISGAPFHVLIFRDPEAGRMLGIVFDEQIPRCRLQPRQARSWQHRLRRELVARRPVRALPSKGHRRARTNPRRRESPAERRRDMGNRACIVFLRPDPRVPNRLSALARRRRAGLAGPAQGSDAWTVLGCGLCRRTVRRHLPRQHRWQLSLGISSNDFSLADVRSKDRMEDHSPGNAGIVVVDTSDFTWKAYGGYLAEIRRQP